MRMIRKGCCNSFKLNQISLYSLLKKKFKTWNSARLCSSDGFEALDLDYKLEKQLMKFKIINPTPIQMKTIPKILHRQNVIINSETGSGKTLAYLLPIFQSIWRKETPAEKSISSIILVPNVELAVQVYNVCSRLGNELNTTSTLCIPGSTLKQSDVVIGTVNEILKYRFDCFESVETIVLDEADFLLQNQLKMTCNILQYFTERQIKIKGASKRPSYLTLPTDIRNGIPIPQFIFCAATLPNNGRKTPLNLIRKYVPGVEHIKLPTTHQLVNELEQDIVLCEDELKLMKLVHIITEFKPTKNNKIIVFVNTGDRAQDLYYLLSGRDTAGDVIKDNKIIQKIVNKTEFSNSIIYENEMISFHKSFKDSLALMHKKTSHIERQTVLDKFLNGDYTILISTDLMARGIDFIDVSTVIQFDYPKNINEYVHRAGRTARAGSNGTLISFIPQNNVDFSKVLERKLKEDPNYEKLFSRNRMLKRRINAKLL